MTKKRHQPIRRFEKRFPIILYHLKKIIQEWGMCRGLSGNDVDELRSAERTIIEKSKKGPFIPYAGQMPDEVEEKDCPII